MGYAIDITEDLDDALKRRFLSVRVADGHDSNTKLKTHPGIIDLRHVTAAMEHHSIFYICDVVTEVWVSNKLLELIIDMNFEDFSRAWMTYARQIV